MVYKMYTIRALDIDQNSLAIVTATGYESPMSALHEIEDELCSILGSRATGDVVFDLLSSNGLEWNRFMSLYLDKGRFLIRSAKVLQDGSAIDSLVNFQLPFFRQHPEYLANSILTIEERSLATAV